MKRALAFAIVAVLTALSLLVLRAAPLQVPPNTWEPTGELAHARAGAASALLYDGRMLVTGGIGTTGAVSAVVERYSPSAQSFLATPPMGTARANHSATLLPDGRVLVAGGVGANGHALSAAEVYDPVTNAWTPVAPLYHARADHTATELYGGRVAIVGGYDDGGSLDSIEIYDPDAGVVTLSNVSLGAPRTGHSAALLYDGTLIIGGGFDGANVLSSVDLYDPFFDTIWAGPPLVEARVGHSATRLLSGKVLVTGGASATNELMSAEIYDPATRTFSPAGNSMIAARQRHQAILLPHNNQVLIVGGTFGGNAVAATETYVEWQGNGGTFSQTNAPGTARAWATGGALSFRADWTIRTGPNDGALLLTGGSATFSASAPFTSSELYGFATVKTDQADYAPGTTVTITGSGWVPGETVTLTLEESPNPEEHLPLTAVADANGNIVNTEFSPDEMDLNVLFYLTARGGVSEAQTAFTDSLTVISATVDGGTSVTLAPSGTSTADVTVTTATTNWRSTGWRVSATAGAFTCRNTPDHDGDGTYSEAFTITAPAGAGTYNAYFAAFSDGSCTTAASPTLTLTNAVIVDASAPTITNVTSTTADGTYGLGIVIPIRIAFNKPVVVTGTPRLTLETGTTDAVVNYASGSGTTTLVFNYTVAAGHSSPDLEYGSTSALALNGGTINDTAGVSATLTLSSPGAAGSLGANKAIVVETTAPTVTNVTSSAANGTYGTGAVIPIQVTFSEVVNVTGTPRLTLETGASDTVVNYASGSGTATLTFNYTVPDDDVSADLDYKATTSLALNGGTIDDVATNSATLTLPAPGAAGSLGANKDLVIDAVGAVVTNVTASTANGSYTVGAVVSIQVIFDGVVTVTGTPRITLETGSTDAVVNYASGSGTTSLTFNYTVAAGHTASDLNYTTSGALVLNGGTITDTLNNAADLTLPATSNAASLGGNKNIVIDTTAPTVSNVTSSTANGTYGTGAVISIQVTFDESVTVTGTPQLTLETGTTDAVVDYASGSGGTTLTFTYTVAAGHSSADLNYLSTTALALNGGSIGDATTNSATLTLPALGGGSSLGGNKALVVDTTPPTVTTVSSSTANGSYGIGAVIAVQVTFSSSVTVTGTPQLTLETGTSDAVVNYSSGSGTATLTFNYTVAAGHASADLDYLSTTALALNGGTIKDAGNNGAILTLAAPGAAGSLGANKNLVVETTVPTVTNVTSSTADGTYGTGAVIPIQVSFSEAVNVTGTPRVTLETGASDTVVNYSSGSGTATLTFNYTVPANDVSADLDYVATASLTLNSGTIKDAAGNAATLTLAAPGAAGSLGANKNLVIDAVAPTVTNVTSSTADGTYGTGAVISIQVSFSKAVNVTGTPQLTLETGATNAVVNYTSGSGSATLTFTYTVAAGHTSADLNYVTTGSLALNGGTIKDAVNNIATLTLPSTGSANALKGNKNLVIDTTGPTVFDITSSTANGTYGTGAVISIQVTFDEPVTITGTPQLTLETGTNDAVVNYASGSGGTSLTFTYTVAAGHSSPDLEYGSTSALALNSGTIRDAAGNNATLTLPTLGGTNSLAGNKALVVDAVAPTVTNVTSSTVNGGYTTGGVISIQVTFSKTVTVTGTPQLTLETGASDAVVNYASGSGTATLTFTYTVAGGHTSADLDYASTTALALNGGTIKDAATNNATLTLASPGAAGSLGANKNLVVDTTAPTVTGVTSSTANGFYTTGTLISIQVVFSESVTVTGTPQLTLETGASDAVVNYASGTGTATLTFTYTVAAGHTSTDLDYGSPTALALNGGTIKDATTNNATLTLASPGAAGSLGANKNLVLDTTAPTVVSTNRDVASPTNALSVSWTVTFSESVTGVGTSDFSLVSSGLGGTPAVTGVSGSGTSYTVTASTGTGTGTLGVNLVDADSIVDGASNTLGGTGTGNGNFTGAVYTIDRTLTPHVTAAGKMYDGTTAATVLTRTLTGNIVSGDDVSLTGGTATFDSKNVGSGKAVTAVGLSLTGTDAAKYVLSATSATTTADITAKALTVTGITASNKAYNGTTSATLTTSSAALVGVVSGDTVTLGTGSATGAFATAAVGTNKPVTVSGLTMGGADAGNYALTQPTTTADITAKALTVTGITASTKAYDGTTSATLNTSGAALVGVVSGDTVTLGTGSATGTFASAAVGTSKPVTVSGLTLGGADAGNYALTQPAPTADITAKGLTVTGITASNKAYDGTTAATLNTSSAALVGVVSGDTVTLGTGSATGAFATAAVGTNKPVTVAGLTLGGANAGNYTLTPPTPTADITAKALTVTGITASNKAYDGTTSATLNTSSAALGGVVSGDTVTLGTGSATGTFASAAVGTNKPVTVAGLTLGGASAGNYTLTPPTPTADITAKALTVTGITASTKAYDGTTSATLNTSSAALVGVVSGDTVTLGTGSATGTFASAAVGTNKPVTVAGLTIGGADAGNYTLTPPTPTADITAKALTVTGITASNKAYDGTTSATLNTSSAALVGVVSGDTVTLGTGSATGAFATAAVGTNKPVTVSGLTMGGADAGNYALTQPTADITAKALTVTGITASTKAYDGTTSATLNTSSAALAGVVSGDTVTLGTGSATGAFASATVGTNKPVTVSGLTMGGADAGNYALTQPTPTADITAKALTVTGITASTKAYDGTTSATLNTSGAALVGVVSGDTVTLGTGSATGAFASAAIGTNKPVTVAGLTIGGANAGNYALTQPATTADITPATLTIAADDQVNGTTGTTSGTSSPPDSQSGSTTSDVTGAPSSPSASPAPPTGPDESGNQGGSSTSTELSTPPSPAATKETAVPSQSAATAEKTATQQTSGLFPASVGAPSVPEMPVENPGNSRSSSSTPDSSSPISPDGPIPDDATAPPTTEENSQLGTTVTVSAANATYGQASVQLTASVTLDDGSRGGVNGGFVTFTVTKNADPIGTAISTTVTRGVATTTFSLNGVAAGRYSIHGVYEPEASNPDLSATNTRSSATLEVALASTTIAITSSRNPSTRKQEVTFTAVVSAEVGGTPTGTVRFFNDGVDIPIATIDLSVVSGRSVATFTTSELPRGVHKLSVAYVGNANFMGSSAGSPLIQTVKRSKPAAKRKQQPSLPVTPAPARSESTSQTIP